MARFVTRRIAYALIITLLASFAVFIIFAILPNDPAAIGCGKRCTPEAIAQNRHVLGYDLPVLMQWWKFMSGLFVGRTFGAGAGTFTCPAPSTGYSFNMDECVTSMIQHAFPATLGLAIGAEILFLSLGISLGILAATKQGKLPDRLATIFVLLGTSLPSFFIGLILLVVFSLRLGWLPNGFEGLGYTSITENPLNWFKVMILPWMTLTIISAAIYTRYTRAQVLEIGSEDFVRTARSKGLERRTILVKHVLRAALAPLVTIAALDFAGLLGGAVFTERIFGLPGLGRLAIESINGKDLPTIVALTMIGSALVIFANLLVDVLYAVLDPRVRAA